MDETLSVTCPACCEVFEIAAPSPAEIPAELDYDCEICCRPMVISVWEEESILVAEARGLGD